MRALFGILGTLVLAWPAGAIEIPNLPPSKDDTHIDLAGIRASLPGHWTRKPGGKDNVVAYRANDASGQLTIELTPARKHLSPLDCRDAVGRLVAHRQTAERKAMGDKTTFTPTSAHEEKGIYTVGYFGHAPSAPHLFATFIVCTKTGTWTFFHETRETSPEVLKTTSNEIAASVTESG